MAVFQVSNTRSLHLTITAAATTMIMKIIKQLSDEGG